jgi:hypothetical protein
MINLASRTRSLNEEEIQRIFRLLGLDSEEERLKILNRLYSLEDTNDALLRIRGDNITTPYHDVNA